MTVLPINRCPSCANCQTTVAQPHYDADRDELFVANDVYRCHRNAPSPGFSELVQWPKVSEEDWCADWEGTVLTVPHWEVAGRHVAELLCMGEVVATVTVESPSKFIVRDEDDGLVRECEYLDDAVAVCRDELWGNR